jgi:vitamin B12 transporter
MLSRNKLSLHLLAALAAAASLPAFAEESPQDLGPIVVTADRAPVKAAETLASVTVITREDIEKSQAPDLLTLLGRQAGIDVARTGGQGQASTVFLRGGNSTHALVLIDGVRVNPATQGAPDFAHLPLAQIERIEIVRGPRAALWGSDAIGGVIQVFTRDPSHAFFESHAGSYRRVGASAGYGVARGDSEIGLSLGYDRLEGFSATNANYPFGSYPDADGYRNRNASLRAGTALGAQRLSFSALASNADVEFDEGDTDARNRVFALQLAGPLAAGWRHALVLGRSTETLDTPVYLSTLHSARNTLDWTLSKAIDEHNDLDLGVNLAGESGYSHEFYAGGFDVDRHNAALFVSWRGRFGAHSWAASLRHDDNSQFGGATTGNLAWGWQAAAQWRLRASVGTAFRAPDFNELYYPGFEIGPGMALFAGNPGLDPERSTSGEVGLDWTPRPRTQVGLSLYRTQVEDLIVFAGPLFDAMNVDRADIDGAELQFETGHGAWSLHGNLNWLDARNRDTDERLLRRAPRKAALSADWSFRNGASAGIDLSAVAARPDAGGVVLAGYGLVDLRASVPLPAGWRFEARVENLGDRDYELVSGYHTPGRSGLLSLRWDGE